jgi:hypothetical protein
MRHLTVSILVTLAVLLGGAGEGFAVNMPSGLPQCPGTYNANTWTNCIGTYTYAKGDIYVGEWKDGNKHGQGTYSYADGDKYVGELKDGKRHGKGTLDYLADNQFKGDIYVGEFKDGKWHGQGTITLADRRVLEGIWENGKFKYAKKP